jgi:hypothetical protein
MTLVSPTVLLSLTKTLCTLILMSFSQENREAQAVRGPEAGERKFADARVCEGTRFGELSNCQKTRLVAR